MNAPLARVDTWRRILLVRLDSLGDVLMCTPAIQALRLACPDAALTLLTSASGAALKPYLPIVDDVMVREVSWMKSTPTEEDTACLGDSDMALVAALRERRFDAAIIMTTATQSALPAALVCRMAGIPVRMAHSRENPYALLSHWRPDSDVVGPGMRHEAQRQLDLLQPLGVAMTSPSRLVFAVQDADRLHARRLLEEAGCGGGRPYVLVHPGASAPSRRYPPESFGQAMRTVAEAGWTCVFCGGPEERDIVAAARAAMQWGSIDLSGRLDLGTLAALIEGADLLVANTSGPAHIAAAVGTPVVCLYALTNPQHTPWQVPTIVLSHEVPCRDCLRSVCPQGTQACLRGVAPEDVAKAALTMLAPLEKASDHVGIAAPVLS
jgi:lipopolysaccharide heptosyltransferase II